MALGIFVLHPRRLADEEPPQAKDFFDPALADLEGRRVETRTYIANSVPHVLSDLAEEEHFDLVAIGPCYPGAVGRIFLGNVGQGLMHGCPAPVAAAPRSYAEGDRAELHRIVVAYDGSPESHEAIVYAEALARRRSARIELLTVDVEETTLPGVIGWQPAVPKTPDEILDDGVAAISPDIAATGRCLSGGSIPATIADYCAHGVDLVVVGSRGYGPVARVLVGSVAAGLLHRASCPVLAVPRPVAAATA
jgi:nucleotide-binding universal stress UspA family protein